MHVNCVLTPCATVGVTGLMLSEAIAAGVTVRFVEPDMPLIAAAMVLVPRASAVANPDWPVLLLIEAAAEEELQVT